MKRYKYRAVDLNGNNVDGVAYVNNETQLIETFEKKDMYLISFKEQKGLLRKSISNRDLVYLTNNLYYGIKSGLSIINVLEILYKGTKKGYIKATLKELKDKILEGYSIYEAFRRTTIKFPEFYITLIRVGENSGKLEEILLELENYYKKLGEINKKTAQAIAYPVFLVVAIILCSVFLVKVPLRSIISTLALPVDKLPILTRVLMNVGNVINLRFLSIVIAIGIILVILLKEINLKKIMYTIPIIKNMNAYKNKYLMFFSMRVMYSSGIDILSSIEILSEDNGLSMHAEELSRVKENLNNGNDISKSMQELDILNEYDLSMLEISEGIGELEKVFSNLSEVYLDRTYRTINFFKSILAPILLAICGIMIAVIMLGIYLPILTMMEYI